MEEQKQPDAMNNEDNQDQSSQQQPTVETDQPTDSEQNSQSQESAEPVSATVEPETSDEQPSQQQETTSSANTEQLEAEIENLKQQLEQEKQQRETINAQAKRLAADFENFRRRSEQQQEEIKTNVKRDILTEILPIVDNLERARSQIKPETDGEMNIHKSYQGVYKQLVDVMKNLGVSKMRPEGEPFDPYYHEAMMREPSNEYSEGTVIEEFRAGYLLDDTVLRHAMVKVASAPESSQQQENENENETSENNNNDNENEEQPA